MEIETGVFQLVLVDVDSWMLRSLMQLTPILVFTDFFNSLIRLQNTSSYKLSIAEHLLLEFQGKY